MKRRQVGVAVAAIAATVVAAGASIIVLSPTDSGESAGLATCGVSVAAGGSWNAAYQAATPGCDVPVAAGTYSGQNIAWISGRDTAAQVRFVPQGQVAINGGLTISASGVYIDGEVTGSISNWRNRSYSISATSIQIVGVWVDQYPHNVTVEGVDTKNLDSATSYNAIVRDVDVGPSVVDGNCDVFENRIGGNGAAAPTAAQNLLWERVVIHDQNRTQVAANNGCHYGGVIWPNGNGITIRESVFERNVVYHLSAGNYSRTDGPRNVLIENSSFGCPVENSYGFGGNGSNVCDGQHAIQVDSPANPPGDPYIATWTIRNNVSTTGGQLVGCYSGTACSMAGLTLSGNVDGAANPTAPALGASPPPPTTTTPTSTTPTTTTPTTTTPTTTTPTTTTPTQPPPVTYNLNAEYDKLEPTSTYKRWANANPGEASKVEAYWRSGGTKPVVATAFGKFLVDAAQEIRR